MIKGKLRRVLRVLALVLLLCSVGSVLLAAYASGGQGGYAPQDCTDAGDAPCYTIDTSRPEWLGGWSVVYLPVITKNYKP